MKVADGFNFLATFVHAFNFSLAGAAAGSFFTNGGPVKRTTHADRNVPKKGFAFINGDDAIIILARLGCILGAPTGIGVHHRFRRSSGEGFDEGPGDAGAMLGSVELMEGNAEVAGAFEMLDKVLSSIKVTG